MRNHNKMDMSLLNSCTSCERNGLEGFYVVLSRIGPSVFPEVYCVSSLGGLNGPFENYSTPTTNS